MKCRSSAGANGARAASRRGARPHHLHRQHPESRHGQERQAEEAHGQPAHTVRQDRERVLPGRRRRRAQGLHVRRVRERRGGHRGHRAAQRLPSRQGPLVQGQLRRRLRRRQRQAQHERRAGRAPRSIQKPRQSAVVSHQPRRLRSVLRSS